MDEKYRQYRFTVNTNYADVENTMHTWNLQMGNIIESNSRVMMSIETIHCSSDLDYESLGLGQGEDEYLDRLNEQNIGYFHGNHSCFEIRCSHVNSRYVYDTSGNHIPLIYCGKLYLQNTNPKEAYCFEVNKDICNGEFRLEISDDDGGANKLPEKITITFILHEYRG